MTELEALQVRLTALSRDWNRLRNIERDWVRARNWFLRAGAVTAGLLFLSVITGAF